MHLLSEAPDLKLQCVSCCHSSVCACIFLVARVMHSDIFNIFIASVNKVFIHIYAVT